MQWQTLTRCVCVCATGEALRITGSIDMQYRAPDGTIVMVDWKRSKEIKMKGYGNKKGT